MADKYLLIFLFMKINYKNTALEMLDNPMNVAIHTPGDGGYNNKSMTKKEDLDLLYMIQGQFANPEFSSSFKENIQYVTQPFYEAYKKAGDKLRPVCLKEPIQEQGTLVFKFEHHTQTMFYRIENSGNGDAKDINAMIIMFTKHNKSDSFALDLFVILSHDDNAYADYIWEGFVRDGRDVSWFISDLLLFKTFLKYVEVESKVIPGEKKDWHIGTKYLNETKSKVQILDSTYFTTISRTEGFGVRGHFRFQPYGIGMQDKKLIWISDFQKTGYTRKAKILNTQ